MDYFSYFSRMTYDGIDLPNVFKRAKINDMVKLDATYFILYSIEDGETPDTIAYNIYKNPNLYWVIMLTNNIINPQFRWPLSSNELDKIIDKKYGPLNVQKTHHYETTTGDVLGKGVVVDSDYSGLKRPVSNYEHEARINDGLRIIRLLRPEYLNEVITQFTKKIK